MSHPLFESKAIQVAPVDKPFLYTSGHTGMYFINTEYLCGGEEYSIKVLENIHKNLSSRELLIPQLRPYLHAIHCIDNEYAKVIEHLALAIHSQNINFITGGERRDWFFSLMAADVLGVPHLAIFKDGEIRSESGNIIEDLQGAVIAHIADLITTASSYTNYWIPALEKKGARMISTACVVDREQGGVEALYRAGVKTVSPLFHINEALFQQALFQEYISPEQFEKISLYVKDPEGTMRLFHATHPNFLPDALKSQDVKIRERAKKAMLLYK